MQDELTAPYGPLDALRDILRLRAPHIAVTCARTPEVPGKLGLRLHVSYLDRPARRIAWDGDSETYVWADGPDSGAKLARDTEQAAERIAWALGAPYSTYPE
ncbi:hypothetical protein [Actinomadura litoris]|uniref:Uncharacterized protein n=1 Tax=Actinomadura litoris TaxID=2678616 RepID=A0A7K1LDR8_9ACTN|nr:hypothetical protein [Actinomadura litoris]MUN42581.1 hypothetical protein [Actinomadura litoris]